MLALRVESSSSPLVGRSPGITEGQAGARISASTGRTRQAGCRVAAGRSAMAEQAMAAEADQPRSPADITPSSPTASCGPTPRAIAPAPRRSAGARSALPSCISDSIGDVSLLQGRNRPGGRHPLGILRPVRDLGALGTRSQCGRGVRRAAQSGPDRPAGRGAAGSGQRSPGRGPADTRARRSNSFRFRTVPPRAPTPFPSPES